MLSVVVKNPYLNDCDKITDMGSEEQEEDTRPELASHVENMDQYDTVFIGFPIWCERSGFLSFERFLLLELEEFCESK